MLSAKCLHYHINMFDFNEKVGHSSCWGLAWQVEAASSFHIKWMNVFCCPYFQCQMISGGCLTWIADICSWSIGAQCPRKWISVLHSVFLTSGPWFCCVENVCLRWENWGLTVLTHIFSLFVHLASSYSGTGSWYSLCWFYFFFNFYFCVWAHHMHAMSRDARWRCCIIWYWCY